LAAAAKLAQSGLRTVVIAGGQSRCETHTFHPGFRANVFADELPPIPARIFWALNLARRGVVFLHSSPKSELQSRVASRIAGEIVRSEALARHPAERSSFFRRAPLQLAPPPDEWSERSLAETGSEDEVAAALNGRAADPFQRGSALHLLAPGSGGSGMVIGGLSKLTEALAAAAQEAGAELHSGLEAAEIKRGKTRMASIALADGTEIEANAVLSTLDLKRSILSLFAWDSLPEAVVKRAANFRNAGSTARVLVALDDVAGPRGVTSLNSSLEELAAAYILWRGGAMAAEPPASVRAISSTDPHLAPRGKATATVTLGAIPHTLFDGGWTHEKRDLLRSKAFAALAKVMPDAKVLASEVIVPPDFEEALGLTRGDFDGGDIAPDQMLANRAWPECPRTPVPGLYLAGPSSTLGPLATCASGWVASEAIITDTKAGLLK
jgi:phytoene dehydrogenase-like protein